MWGSNSNLKTQGTVFGVDTVTAFEQVRLSLPWVCGPVDLEVPHYASIYKSKKHFGHSFAYDAPRISNDLPDDVRSAKSLLIQKKVESLPL